MKTSIRNRPERRSTLPNMKTSSSRRSSVEGGRPRDGRPRDGRSRPLKGASLNDTLLQDHNDINDDTTGGPIQIYSLVKTLSLRSVCKCIAIVDDIVWIGLGDGGLLLYGISTGESLGECGRRRSSAMATCLAYQMGTRLMWIGSSDGSLQAWSVDGIDQHKPAFFAHHAGMRSIATCDDAIWTAADDWYS